MYALEKFPVIPPLSDNHFVYIQRHCVIFCF